MLILFERSHFLCKVSQSFAIFPQLFIKTTLKLNNNQVFKKLFHHCQNNSRTFQWFGHPDRSVVRYCSTSSGGSGSGSSPQLGHPFGATPMATTRVLSVAEKNDAAKRIAELLAGGSGNVRRREGRSKFNKIYEFECRVMGRPCRMSMTSVSGHLLTYAFPAQYKSWQSHDPVILFDAPVHKQCPPNYEQIKQTLEEQAVHNDLLVIWTDCDREGENIGYEVINVCLAKNPRLKVFRAKFSEITSGAISRAINTLGQPDLRVSQAVDVRSELDLRIGAAFTRFQTLRLQRKFGHLKEHLISYGSCQFPTLGFVVERYKAILDFVPEDFWKIEVTHMADGCSANFNWARVRLFNERACLSIFEKILESPTATVLKVTKKPKSKYRPVALDTVEFEKLASRKLRINAKEAMKIAEKLYTAGIISYPRTETNIFPKSLNLVPLIESQTGHRQWGAFANNLLAHGPNPRNGKKSDQAHPPIHPTRFVDNLTGNEGKVYELIVRHFLACCSKDALGHETTVEIDIAEERFYAHGLAILERNYLEVYIYDKWSDKELPQFNEGEQFQPSDIEMKDSQTSPPNLLTEADLISLMEKHGIGTDATHAEHIETIKTRAYVGMEDNKFVPGCLGMGLVEGYDSMGFDMSKPFLRAELEADLKRICDGVKNPDDVLNEQIQKYREVFVQAIRQADKIDQAIQKFVPVGSVPPTNNFRGGGSGGGSGFNPPPPRQPMYPQNNQSNRPPSQFQPRPARGITRGGHNSSRSRGTRGASRGRGAGAASTRRCGACQTPGHTRRNCPQGANNAAIPDDFDFDFDD